MPTVYTEDMGFDQTRKTAVGDLTSEAKGTGARDNGGKLRADLLPYSAVADLLPRAQSVHVRDAVGYLGEFQAGDDSALPPLLRAVAAATGMSIDEIIAEGARVYAYGEIKYKAWNWSKGQPYSVIMACIYRHLMGDPTRGVPGMWHDALSTDPESGLLHAGHVACNVMMLAQFLRTYREGDDRPLHLFVAPF